MMDTQTRRHADTQTRRHADTHVARGRVPLVVTLQLGVTVEA